MTTDASVTKRRRQAMNKEWIVTVIFGACGIRIDRFKDEQKARDYYADCLLKYPKNNVEFMEPRI